MSELDLDISHYDMEDLETFFRLEKPYHEQDIAQKESELRTLLLSSGHIEAHFKRDLIMFLEEGKKRLIAHHIQVKVPTTIYKQEPAVPHSYPLPNIKPPTREENVILEKKTEFSYQQVSEFFPGQLNPLDTRILKKCLSIDTRFCTFNQNHSDFILSLPNKIQKVVSMECASLEIDSHCLYNISESLGNNYIYVSICAKEKEYNRTFIIPDGHYDIGLLLATLNRMCIDEENTPFVFLEWKCDPHGSNKCVLMIRNDEDPYYLEKIRFISLDFTVNVRGELDKTQEPFTRLGYLLGFTQKKYSNQMSYMGEIPMNPNMSLPYFYLAIDDYQNRSVASFQPAFAQITMPPANLARISLNHRTNEVHIVSTIRKYFGPVDLTRLQIRLLDPRGKPIQMHTNFSFCLLFDTVYDL
jgi:hypothetical protein